MSARAWERRRFGVRAVRRGYVTGMELCAGLKRPAYFRRRGFTALVSLDVMAAPWWIEATRPRYFTVDLPWLALDVVTP